jgi:hypothetical protein
MAATTIIVTDRYKLLILLQVTLNYKTILSQFFFRSRIALFTAH